MKHIFLVNAKAGKQGFATKLRKELAQMPGLDYYVFNTRRAGDESALVKMVQDFFEGERLRFYCCGGSGTMRNMLNGFEHLDDVEIAFYPCGLTNDFIKTFGEKAKLFADIRNLIGGKVMQVDYLKSNCGIMLNTFSFGLDTFTVQKMEEYRTLKLFNDNLPYNLGVVGSILTTRLQKYVIEADGVKYEGGVTELFYGNGNVLGGNLYFFRDADTTDGLGQLRIVPPRQSLTCFPIMISVMNQRMERLDRAAKTCKSSFLKVRRQDGGEVPINQDGELIRGVHDWSVEVVPKGLNLIVPKEVLSDG